MPLAWRHVIQPPDLVVHLFSLIRTDVRGSASTAIKVKSAQCLQHLAYVRHAIFESAETRYAFLGNFMQEMTKLINSPAFEHCILVNR